MAIKVKIDFINGDFGKERLFELQELVNHVKEGQKVLYSYPIERLIKILDKFASNLLKRSNPIHSQFPGSGVPYLANWCRKRHIESLLDISFQNRRCLDAFVEASKSSETGIRAFPKGLVIHWMSGNVPILGFISLLMGILSKNANIIKQASESDSLLQTLLKQLTKVVDENNFEGYDLMKSVAVIRYNHQETEIGSFLSSKADVRIIWGSDESVRAIRSLPSKLGANDVIFPNRTSFIIIGGTLLESKNLARLTKRIAQDVSVFEQKACASPHTIFLATDDDEKVKAFANELKNAMQSALVTFPKITPSHKEISAILNLRAQYDMFHDAWYSSGTEFTILSDDLLQLGPPIGNRTVYLRKLTDLGKLADIITPNVQTVGLAVDRKDFDQVSSILGESGVHRITKIGTMTHFDMPWDGYLVPHHLVRWTSRPAK